MIIDKKITGRSVGSKGDLNFVDKLRFHVGNQRVGKSTHI